jgi:proline racemase
MIMTPCLRTVETVDYHTAGEPFRIVRPQVTIAGETVAERRIFAMDDPDVQALRRLLCYEPRGHADMYGGFVVPPDDDGAHLGVLFWHKDGFSTACGHGTMALGAWAIHTGLVTPDASGVTDVRIDVPSGRVTARVRTDGDQVVGVDFVNVPSYVLHREVGVSTSRGEVTVDVVYGGAIYAHLAAADVGLRVAPEGYADLISIGREVKHLLNNTDYAAHPDDDRLSGIYGTILFDDLGTTTNGDLSQRNVTVFADGEVDRSPCGSGTASRVALLAAAGALTGDRQLVHESIVGTVFRARVAQQVEAAGRSAVVPEVSGMAYRTGSHVFELDSVDTLGEGFVLR